MKKRVLTLGKVENIKLKFGEDIWEKYRELVSDENEKLILEFRVIFESKDDKAYKLINDYVHLMNKRVCDRSNENNCLLCDSLIQECETKCGRKKYAIILARSDGLTVKQEKITGGKPFDFDIAWNIKEKQKHYELNGLLSESILPYFKFPITLFQYSSSRMFLTLSSSTSNKIIWSSNTFLVNNFTKFSFDSENNDKNTSIIFESIKKNDLNEELREDDVKASNTDINGVFIYNDSRLRVISRGQVNVKNLKKYSVSHLIEKTIEMHKLFKSYRKLIQSNTNIVRIVNQQNNWKIEENTDENINIKVEDNYPFISEDLTNEDDFEALKMQEKKKNQEEIQEEVTKLQKSHQELKLMIKEKEEQVERLSEENNELFREINILRSDLINKISYCIYPITLEKKTGNMRIRNILLPLFNIIYNFDNKHDPEISSSLGYSLHFVEVITKILEIPNSKNIQVKGSFSKINELPLYCYPSVEKKHLIKALRFYKSIIYDILSYFNINCNSIRKILSSNNALYMIIAIKNYLNSI
ncbi:hypothetical protein HWI79_964 [Cryptosporidium felis]|nr:hypothetical protein HWI79_964 [Cryptosporidium felis]